MAKDLNELIQDRHLPADLVKRMEGTGPGLLSAALGAMVYARSHDKDMKSVYPEKVYVGVDSKDSWRANKIGFDGNYIKSDVAIARVIDLLDALALQHALENR